MYRHGDVIIAPVDRIPDNVMRRHSSVLARGEATGHSHRAADAASVELYDGGEVGVGYMRVPDRATLIHDEHKPIDLPAGNYRFWHQREYTPKEIRRIID
jgi:hypothetical protein